VACKTRAVLGKIDGRLLHRFWPVGRSVSVESRNKLKLDPNSGLKERFDSRSGFPSDSTSLPLERRGEPWFFWQVMVSYSMGFLCLENFLHEWVLGWGKWLEVWGLRG